MCLVCFRMAEINSMDTYIRNLFFCRNFVVLSHFKHLNILDNVSNIC